ncbi:hypothetical protein PROPHIGD54-2_43 [Mycobacterium phage prophiGD54-2]|nr:hypothetical protein PROPHIGD54-2_43 [Mycobacterium phage prophiGD54-2]
MTDTTTPEIRVSADRLAVAIQRSDGRWAVMHREVGGHYAPDAEVADWAVL